MGGGRESVVARQGEGGLRGQKRQRTAADVAMMTGFKRAVRTQRYPLPLLPNDAAALLRYVADDFLAHGDPGSGEATPSQSLSLEVTLHIASPPGLSSPGYLGPWMPSSLELQLVETLARASFLYPLLNPLESKMYGIEIS